jgi:hypothetical protein
MKYSYTNSSLYSFQGSSSLPLLGYKRTIRWTNKKRQKRNKGEMTGDKDIIQK